MNKKSNKREEKTLNELEKWQFDIQTTMTIKGLTGKDIAQVIGVTAPAVTECIKKGAGSDRLKLAISKAVGVTTPWRRFEDYVGEVEEY